MANPHEGCAQERTTSPGPAETDCCCICLQAPLLQQRGTLSCGHHFCFGCIHGWSSTNATCPLCLQPFTAISCTTANGKMFAAATAATAATVAAAAPARLRGNLKRPCSAQHDSGAVLKKPRRRVRFNLPQHHHQKRQQQQEPPTAAAAGHRPPTHAQEQQRRRAQQQQRERLLLLRHACQCTAAAGTCRATALCAEMKVLWRHVRACAAPDCAVEHCRSSRFVLGHYHGCRDDACGVCAPVRAFIQRTGATPQEQRQHAARTAAAAAAAAACSAEA